VPSAALGSLVGVRLAEVGELVALRPTALTSATAARRDAVNRATVVLLCAHFEGFLEDLIGELIDELNASTPDTDDVPLRLRAAHVVPEIEAIAGMTDPAGRAERVGRLFRAHGDLWTSGPLTFQLEAAKATSDMSNPGAREVGRLFQLVGIDDPFVEAVLPDGSAPETRINEFVGVRNSVAHGEGTRVTDDQITRYLGAVEAVGRGLDIVVARHVQKITHSPTLPWS
jgi:hypothetical protein